MKTLLGILCTSCLTLCGFAQQPVASEAMSQVSRSATQELAKSSQELARLREQIASEQLPLAQELTSAEELLVQLRREYETVSRTVDNSNLDLPRIKTDNTFRQDELTYLGNLLDDYARTFESKVHVSELQYSGKAIEDAKQASEDTTLTLPEKFARQLAFVDFSVRRLADAIGGMRFEGIGVDAQGTVSEGQFAIIGPVALFCAQTGGAAGLVVPQTGSNIPLIRPLEGALQAGLVALVQTGDGQIPLDPSRGGALKALVQKTNLIHIFEKGGPIMWPLLAASILALGTVLDRLFFLMREKMKRDSQALDRFFAAVGRNEPSAAAEIAKGSKFYVLRALGYALTHDEQSLPHALMYAQAQEMKRFRRGIPILDTVITLAPLLGLLGTVTGMMGSFSLIGGELSAPGAITGGIAEALIATAFGLGIAITALIPFNYLNTRADEASHELESAGAQLELLVRGTQVVEHILRPAESTPAHEVPRPPTTPTPHGRHREMALPS